MIYCFFSEHKLYGFPQSEMVSAVGNLFFFFEIIRTLLTYITYNNDNNQDELIINYNLLKIIVYESCTAYDKVFPPVTHF